MGGFVQRLFRWGRRPTRRGAEQWYNQGVALERLGRYEEALLAYDAALRLRPAFPEACNNSGALLLLLGRWRRPCGCSAGLCA